MCTVTFLPTANGVYLTSNRDEHKSRTPALAPQWYHRNGHAFIYPKDPVAGGTWIALSDKRDAAVLLNGAFKKHNPQPPYGKSRGLAFLEIFEAGEPLAYFRLMNMSDVEPFTLLLFVRGTLQECRWDGTQKYLKRLDERQPHIWSSATLYDAQARSEREYWFEQWLKEEEDADMEKILNFHKHAGKGDQYNGLVINRAGEVCTRSITAIFIGARQSEVRYLDLESGSASEQVAPVNTRPAYAAIKEPWHHKLSRYCRRFLIRTSRWEYWPSWLVYCAIYPYWLWLSLRARSFFFFSAANPGIAYAGFAQECKSDIYKIIPEQYHPKTILWPAGTQDKSLKDLLVEQGFHFPLIAKPDIGERGMQVKLIRSLPELEAYRSRSRVDFLIQEYIDYEQEAGIFYYRMPGEDEGHISGIVGKEFLVVTGDGLSSMEELLCKEDRFFLQLSALRFAYGAFLDTVLPQGASYTLMPYGNHSRGAKFMDQSHKINEELKAVINKICLQIPGFYYGRLDIKFSSWEALYAGREFSIIELNGAGSEPTHIYDPGHSLFFAWKEVCRHWKLLYKISRENAAQQGLPLMTIAEGINMKKKHSRYLKLMTQV